ncbi:hypothetical protein H8959_002087 [Pygathrix nigripes]
MQWRGPWPVEDAEVEVERMAFPKSSATRGFGLVVLLPPGPRSRAARRDEDARDSAAGRALRAVRAVPTKSSSPATRRLSCVGAEGRFSAPLSAAAAVRPCCPRTGTRPSVLALRRSLARAASVADRAPRSASAVRDLGEPPPLSPRSPHALPGCAARSPLLSLPPPPPPSPPPPSSASFPARVVANRRPPSCGCSRPDPRQQPAPAPPKRPVFCCSPRGVAGGKPGVRRAPPRQVEGLREIK